MIANVMIKFGDWVTRAGYRRMWKRAKTQHKTQEATGTVEYDPGSFYTLGEKYLCEVYPNDFRITFTPVKDRPGGESDK